MSFAASLDERLGGVCFGQQANKECAAMGLECAGESGSLGTANGGATHQAAPAECWRETQAIDDSHLRTAECARKADSSIHLRM